MTETRRPESHTDETVRHASEGPTMPSGYVPGKVSVVGSYYNRAHYAKEAVESLLAQDYDNFEIVLIDDGSTDDTYAVLSSFDDPRLRVVRQSNIGFVRSIRRAIEMTDGEYVSVHGSGDIADPYLLRRCVEVLQARPDIGLVGTWVVNDDRTKNGTSAIKQVDLGEEPGETLLRAARLSHGGSMYRRVLYDEVGGYRTLFTYAQDHDLWLRMSEHAGIHVISQPLYRRLKLTGGVSTSPEKRPWQILLSELAIFCATERRISGVDPLDRLGEIALLLVSPSRRLGNYLASSAVSNLMAGDRVAARSLARASLRAAASPRSRLVAWGVLLAGGNSRASRIVYRLLVWRRQTAPRADTQ